MHKANYIQKVWGKKERILETPDKIMELVCQRFIDEILKDYDRNDDTKLKMYTAFAVYICNKFSFWWCIRGLTFEMAPPFNNHTPLEYFKNHIEFDCDRENYLNYLFRAIKSVENIAEQWEEI
jgi:hypothetical protein